MTNIKIGVAHVFFYFVFLMTSFLLVGLFFTTFIAPQLWYEWDSMPILDLVIPPSTHTEAGAHFIASPAIVYGTWILFLVLTFLIPVFLTQRVIKERKKRVVQ